MSATINARSTLHKGRVFELVSENITLENGVTTDMEFVHHPGATAIVPMLNKAEIILIKQYRHTLRDYIWEIPAGTLDPNESPIACAQRELIEETGYSAQNWQQLGEITPVPGYSDERIWIFLANEMQAAAQNLDEDEIVNVHKVRFDEAINMIHHGEIQDSKTIVGLFLAFTWVKNELR
jgi:ADP-ribose pyrophosphatase